MENTRWQQIDELFDEVLDLPESEREAFLSEKCKDDAELKNEVLALLKAGSDSEKFLEKSVMGIAARNIAVTDTNIAKPQLFGKIIGTYKIESLLGSGGMGEVYLASDEKLKRKVALKILPAEYVSSDERVKRFQLEARAISALNHPNIVTIYDVGTHEGINYIATEFVEGKTFRELIGTGLKVKEVLGIIIQTCEALSAAHNAGIIHRDIKPENIIVRPDGYVKILDFGLAKLTEIDFQTLKDFSKTAKGVIIGTPAYMSPEQVADDRVDHRTDLWSVGVVLYELLTGINPFKKANRQATFQTILSEDPPLASSINSEISPELDQILVKALEKEADLSYQTASDLRADLKRIKREIDSSPSWNSVSGAQNRKPATTPRNYLFFSAAILFLLLLAGGIWFFFFKNSNSKISENNWSKAKNIQVTESLSIESYPSLSPDGKSLVFSMEKDGNQDIFWQRIGGKNLTNLTGDSKEIEQMPVYSPNGDSIAFRSERNGGGIFTMGATGENVRRISDFGFHPSWSPDGKKIVVSDKSAIHHTLHSVPNSALWVLDISVNGKQQLETKGDAIMPNWSPNGDRIAYWFVGEGKLGEIATIPASGGEPVIITNDDFSDWNPVWSPDGKFLYFASDRGGSMGLWRIAIDEKTGKALSEPEPVATPSKYCRHITFSRDGNLLGYIRYESKSNLQSVKFDEKTQKIVGEIEWITRGNHEITNPHLSPNGEEYLVRNVKPTQEDLVVFNKNGENWRNLTNDKYLERIPSWSHDGKKIVFHSDRSGKYQVWTIDADGNNLKQITFSEKTGAFVGVFSPDDKKLVYSEIDGKKQRPYILDLTKSWTEQTPQPLNLNKNSYAWVGGWSPDGNKLLLLTFGDDGNVDSLGVYDLRTSNFEKMADQGTSPFWLSDSRHFIFSNLKGIYLVDSETKKTTEILKPSDYEIQSPNISSDYKTLYFRYLQVDADVWLLDNSNSENQPK
ncbi:MAG: protein kinase [Pyrinomonadaceae bacterium]|nr:protein kinase [Pyrinomonadaceae bacterium]